MTNEEYRQQYAGNYSGMFGGRSTASQHVPKAPCTPQDCQTEEGLEQWRAAELAKLRFAPEAFRGFAEKGVERDFAKAKAHLPNATSKVDNEADEKPDGKADSKVEDEKGDAA